jgi:hypothetical protein
MSANKCVSVRKDKLGKGVLTRMLECVQRDASDAELHWMDGKRSYHEGETTVVCAEERKEGGRNKSSKEKARRLHLEGYRYLIVLITLDPLSPA